jgi:hypothetical protein
LLQYVCEWCSRGKKRGDRWILGFAAEKVGPTSARREMTVAGDWSEKWAAHPLAVHFCSEKHKEKYVRALFEVATASQPQSRRRTTMVSRNKTVSPKASGGATVRAQDCEPAKPQRAAKPSRSKRRSARQSKAALVFEMSDGVRAHGLSVRLDDSSLARHAADQEAGDIYSGA